MESHEPTNGTKGIFRKIYLLNSKTTQRKKENTPSTTFLNYIPQWQWMSCMACNQSEILS